MSLILNQSLAASVLPDKVSEVLDKRIPVEVIKMISQDEKGIERTTLNLDVVIIKPIGDRVEFLLKTVAKSLGGVRLVAWLKGLDFALQKVKIADKEFAIALSEVKPRVLDVLKDCLGHLSAVLERKTRVIVVALDVGVD